MLTLPSETEMYEALLRRDASYEGVFLVGVTSTGIFCRPTCGARKPRRENVEFYPDAQAALLAGYRPCQRCRPLEPDGHAPPWVGPLLVVVQRQPQRRLTDADLRARSIDPATVRRYFKSRYGMTFQAYQRAWRLGEALGELRQGGEVSRVGLDHGFESTSGFREAFERLFGAPPGRGRETDCLRVSWLDTPIGPFVAGATRAGVCLFEFTDRRALEGQILSLRRRIGLPAVPGSSVHLDQLGREVGEYFAGQRQRFTVPLDLHGTEFQELVWRRLLEIPYGRTMSYGEVARAIGRPGASRAVARANGQNRIAVIIPCHRVIGSDGTLTGYGGGLWRKRFLLELERGSDRATERLSD